VERLPVVEGQPVEFDRVLLVADDQDVTVGTPIVDGARVLATSRGDVKDDKIIVLRYKNKVRHRVKTGHRQIHTRLLINEILRPVEDTEVMETVPEETSSGS
jgi:large subunit ribosomal protein L21